MIDNMIALIAFPDYGSENNGKFFVWNGEKLTQKTVLQISLIEDTIISIGFSAIASEIVNHKYSLPNTVIDLQELLILTSKEPKTSKIRKEFSVTKLLKRFGVSDEDLNEFNILNSNSKEFDHEILKKVGMSMIRAFKVISRLASIRGEWERFLHVEAPVANVLFEHLFKGINFDDNQLALFRESIEYDYYKALKCFSKKHNLPLEVPSNKDLQSILENCGFDLSNESVDYLLEFISLENNFGEDVLNLKKLKLTKDTLNGISHKKNITFPHVTPQGTRTSRILLQSPQLQNIPKKYRSILLPSNTKEYSYIDYDQFEVGIMGVLSDDPILLKLYEENNLYLNMAEKLFKDKSKRKDAKKLFLSYAYGMSRKNLIKAAINLGSTKLQAKDAFDQFDAFEIWKETIIVEFSDQRKIGTSMGNYYYLQHGNKPSAKEVRSAISQKVQATGSLIFKLVCLELNEHKKFRIVLPMHDALLVEHDPEIDPLIVVKIFEDTMTNFFDNKIKGRASISNFASS